MSNKYEATFHGATPVERATNAVRQVPVSFNGCADAARAAFESIDRDELVKALLKSPDSFSGNGEEIGVGEFAILIEDAADAILEWLTQ